MVRVSNWKAPFYDYLVDWIAEDWELPINATFSQRRLQGLKGHAGLSVSARVACTRDKFCQNCSRICGE